MTLFWAVFNTFSLRVHSYLNDSEDGLVNWFDIFFKAMEAVCVNSVEGLFGVAGSLRPPPPLPPPCDEGGLTWPLVLWNTGVSSLLAFINRLLIEEGTNRLIRFGWLLEFSGGLLFLIEVV